MSTQLKPRWQDSSFLLPAKLYHNKMKTLVLDLDETLVHSSVELIPDPHITFTAEIDGKSTEFYVLIRPGVSNFLEKMCELYEVIIYTASIKCYANEILKRIDPRNLIFHRLYREDCTILGSNIIKNLARLGRDLKDVIIVDNSPLCYRMQPCNGIPVKTWIGDEDDKELEELMPVLEGLAKVDDVRDYLRELVIDNIIDYDEAIKMIEKHQCRVPLIDINKVEEKKTEFLKENNSNNLKHSSMKRNASFEIGRAHV